MKNITLKIMLIAIYIAIGSISSFGQITYILQEDFASATTGSDTSTGNLQAWTGSGNFPTASNVWQAGGAIRIGNNTGAGSITSKALDLSGNGGNFNISFDVKGFSTVEGDILITITNLSPATTVTYKKIISEGYENKILNFTGGTAGSTVKIETTAKRAFIDNVKIYYTSGTVAPSFTPAPNTYNAIQNVTLNNGSSTDKIYYTLNGSTPDNTSSLYTSPITISSSTVIKAIAYDDNNANPSDVVSGEYIINPIVNITETTVPPMFAYLGANKTQTIIVSGINLTGNISIATTGNDAAMFSVSPATITPIAGSVSNTTVTITYTPAAQGQHSATLRVTSPGAVAVTRALNAVSTLAAPIAQDATVVNATSFKANWQSVNGATEYKLNVYTSGEVTQNIVFYENFDKFISGTVATPTNLDISGVLDGLTQFPGWSGTNLFQADKTVKVGTNKELNSIVTPAIDLTGNNVKLNFSAVAWSDDQTAINVLLDGVSIATPTIIADQATWTDIEIPITGGTTSSKITFIGVGADGITTKGRFFLNNLTIKKDTPTKNAIAGSPFTVTDNSYDVSGLTTNSTYYYTLTAGDGASSASALSNEITVITTLSTSDNVWSNKNIPVFAKNGKLIFTAELGETVEVFSALGQKLLQVSATQGVNEIPAPADAKGVLIIKIGDSVSKLINNHR